MDNLKVCLLLHFYQPWWQFPATLRKISSQCYKPILRLVTETGHFCFTANINLSLLQLFERESPDLVEEFGSAIKSGKIELMNSSAQHPIFPLIPEEVQIAHIEEDRRRKHDTFGLESACSGFYFPELAFSQAHIKLLTNYGYQWSILDDEPFRVAYGYVPFDHISVSGGFKLYLRSNLWSNRVSSGQYSWQDIKSKMECEIPSWTGGNPAYLILAMDAETFGHHHECLIESFLKPLLSGREDVSITPIEDLAREFPSRSIACMPDGSWSTSEEDVRKSDWYPLWNSRFNVYHHLLWRLIHSALLYFSSAKDDCLKITSSCHWWWISGRPHWEPEFMKFGARKAIAIIRQWGQGKEVEEAEEIFQKLEMLY